MRAAPILITCLLILASPAPGGKALGQAPKPAASSPAFSTEAFPVVARYCVACHGAEKPKAGLNLSAVTSEAAVLKDLKSWERVLAAVREGSMPPDDRPQPTASESSRLVHYLESLVSKASCKVNQDPGRVTLRRLNREEYNNTIRDLVGIDFRPADDFPSDDVGYGFDNNGDVLSLPPLLMEKYLSAAEAITEMAILADEHPQGPTRRFKAESLAKPGSGGVDGETSFWLMASNNEVGVDHAFTKSGNYILRARAYGEQAGKDLPKMVFLIDGKPARSFDVKVEADAPAVFEAKLKIRMPVSRFAAAFTNDEYHPDDPNPRRRDRNLAIDWLEVVGPMYSLPNDLPESHKLIIFQRPTPINRREVAREVLQKFATRAFRRPATSAEIDRLVGFVDLALKNGDRFERGIQLAVQAVLVSPNFLFRVELDTRPGASRRLNDLELASRLSYFLWSSMPDDELLDLATKGQLRAGKNLDVQVARMLKHPKSKEFVENFTGQWLQTRNLKLASPDRGRFESFDEPLRQAMIREVELFFAAVIHDDRPITDFLHADYTYVNERLAKHYGIAGVSGDKFRRVALTDAKRGGVVTMASTLTVTSNPTRTSPVKRGKWILEEILGTPPPPPPPNVADLSIDDTDDSGKRKDPSTTLRVKLEQHRADAACASCHARMDPLGFGLENFDAVGGWRDKDGPFPIDSSGVLPGGQKFSGPVELKKVLLSRLQPFSRCLTEKLMTYALGRGLEYPDRCVVERVADATVADGGKFSSLVSAIVHSDPFQMRGVEGNVSP